MSTRHRAPTFLPWILLLAAGGLGYGLLSPYRGFSGEVFLDIPRGAGTREIAARLSRHGVVRSRWLFLAARLLHPRARLQAGEYRFEAPESPWTVFQRIARGDVFYYEVTVPEGSNAFDIAGSVARLDFLSAEGFLRAARDASLIRDLAPKAPSLEGFLFPSTYRIARHTTSAQLCRMMTSQFRKRWQALAPGRRVDTLAAVTLASLIEKETAAPDERPLIASVFTNRLALGMTLDCDPTAIYAALLEKRYRGAIHRSDLDSGNPYNTYRHAGLPPGPIANPGEESLRAALSPARSDFLYFVARPGGAGTHRFSRTLDEHNRAVKAYRHEQARPSARLSGSPKAGRRR